MSLVAGSIAIDYIDEIIVIGGLYANAYSRPLISSTHYSSSITMSYNPPCCGQLYIVALFLRVRDLLVNPFADIHSCRENYHYWMTGQ